MTSGNLSPAGSTSGLATTRAAVVADGSRIAYEREGRLWIANADGSGARALDLDVDVAASPIWLPGDAE